MNKFIVVAVILAITLLSTFGQVIALEEKSEVSITLNPAKQSSSDGLGVYKVIVQDLHGKGSGYIYKISFVSKTADGSFFFKKTETVTLDAGESKTILLSVKTEKKGFNTFKVIARGMNTPFKDVVTGTLIYFKPVKISKVFSFPINFEKI